MPDLTQYRCLQLYDDYLPLNLPLQSHSNQKDRVFLDIHMTPYFPAKNYVFKLDGQKGDDPDSADWKADYEQE